VIDAGRELLAARGLGLFSVLDTSGIEAIDDPYPSLVVVGSAGPRMWESIGDRGFFDGEPDPVDRHAAEALADFCASVAAPTRILWPGGESLPMREIGRRAGWGHVSRLGVNIHPTHGLWHAFRGLIAVDAELPEQLEPPSLHPCERCDGTPCISACPVGAVGGPKGLVIRSCFDERVRPGGCASACLARRACPVGTPYSEAQIAHHFGAATRSLVRWFGRA
jgi:hypothetical protein